MDQAGNKVEWTPKFRSQLVKLSRKHRGLEDQVIDILKDLADGKIPRGDRISGVEGRPVFKVRIPLGNRGKRGGARIIYYRGEDRLWALFLYAKGEKGNISDGDIRKALADYVP